MAVYGKGAKVVEAKRKRQAPIGIQMTPQGPKTITREATKYITTGAGKTAPAKSVQVPESLVDPNAAVAGQGQAQDMQPIATPTATTDPTAIEAPAAAGTTPDATTDAAGGPETSPTSMQLAQQFQQQAEAANLANQQRYQEGKGIYQQLADTFGKGGAFEAAALDQYQRQKERDMATAQQSLVSSGLFGTTQTAALPTTYEAQVGVPYRLQMADLLARRQAEAQGQLAQFVERREDEAPRPELMADLMMQAESRPADSGAVAGTTGTGGGTTDGAGGTAGDTTGAGTGGATGGVGGAATNLLTQNYPISQQQYSQEMQRQQTLAAAQSYIDQTPKVIKQLEAQQKAQPDTPQGEAAKAHIQSVIDAKHAKMEEMQQIVENNKTPLYSQQQIGAFQREQEARQRQASLDSLAEKRQIAAERRARDREISRRNRDAMSKAFSKPLTAKSIFG